MRILLSSSLIFPTITSKADDTIALDKGVPAPFSGLLMTTSKAKVLRSQLLERDALLQEKESFEKSLALYADIESLNQQKVGLLTTENERLSKQLGIASTTTNWERALYFGLGTLATGLIFYAASQSVR